MRLDIGIAHVLVYILFYGSYHRHPRSSFKSPVSFSAAHTVFLVFTPAYHDS